VRVVGVSTTAMDSKYPRYSTSDSLLEVALSHAVSSGAETQLIKLSDLKVENCRGYYSKSAFACTWPCSITQMDPTDQMERVYEAFVHWADVIVIATPIRWGNASALYYKMVERMNCIQNQETIANKRLMHNKVAAFIITGGQDNVQSVAGQLLGFFAELGCQFPQFPYIAHSRGWSAEDMENNMRYVMKSESLKEGTRALLDRGIKMAELMISATYPDQPFAPGGRKAHELDVKAQI
jgi:multimeric flavodoxin WrbA